MTMTGRRRFLGSTVMTLAAARFGIFGGLDANAGEPRELAALGRATEWLNSSRLSATGLLGKVVLVQFGTYHASTGCARFRTFGRGTRGTSKGSP